MSWLSGWLRARETRKVAYTRSDFIRSGRLRKDERFLQFLCFGFSFDPARPRQVADDLTRKKHDAPDIFRHGWAFASRDEQFAAVDQVLGSVVADAARSVGTQHKILLGLSGGFDSRLLLYQLRKQAIDFTSFTFNREFDANCARELAERLHFEHTQLQYDDWKLEDLYEQAAIEQDIVFVRRLAASVLVARHFPGHVQFHGHLGGALSGANLKDGASRKWSLAVRKFIRRNDPFNLAGVVGGEELLPSTPLLSSEILDYDTQLDLTYRQEFRIRPSNRASYRYPYSDPRWMGFWLNRSVDERADQRLYVEFIRWLDCPEFKDVSSVPGVTGRDVKANLAALYSRTPPAGPSSGGLIRKALPALRARNVFARDFLDTAERRMSEGGPDAKAFGQLICCTELALGAGLFRA